MGHDYVGKIAEFGEAVWRRDPRPNDLKLDTKWFDGNMGPLILDFGEGGGVDLQKYSWATADDAPERDAVRWTLKGTNNIGLGATWTMLDD